MRSEAEHEGLVNENKSMAMMRGKRVGAALDESSLDDYTLITIIEYNLSNMIFIHILRLSHFDHFVKYRFAI